MGFTDGLGTANRGKAHILNQEGAVMDEMKDQYDFSKGVRGKFFVAEDDIRLPRYLEPGIERKFTHIAERTARTPDACLIFCWKTN